MKPLSRMALEILRTLHRLRCHPGSERWESWPEVWAHAADGLWSYQDASLAFRNFERVGGSLVRRGLVIDGDLGVQLTDAGARAGRPPHETTCLCGDCPAGSAA